MDHHAADEDLTAEEHIEQAAAHLDEASKQIDKEDGAQEELAQVIRGLEIIHNGFTGHPTEDLTIEIRA